MPAALSAVVDRRGYAIRGQGRTGTAKRRTLEECSEITTNHAPTGFENN